MEDWKKKVTNQSMKISQNLSRRWKRKIKESRLKKKIQ